MTATATALEGGREAATIPMNICMDMEMVHFHIHVHVHVHVHIHVARVMAATL